MPVALPALAAADLLTLLAWLVCLGLVIAWRHTIGRAIIWLADELDKAAIDLPWPVGTVHVFGPLTSALRWLEGSIAHWLGEAALATEHATIWLWNHLVSIVEEIAHWVEESAQGYLLFGEWVVHHAIPDARSAAIAAAREAVAVATHPIRAAVQAEQAVVRRMDAVITADVLPGIRGVEHDLGALKAKLERLTSSLSRDALVALIGATIWKELFGGTRCSSWDKLVKNQGCNAWSGLEDLLGLAAALDFGFTLEELAAAARPVVEDLAPVITQAK